MEEQLIELETAKLAYDKGLRRRGQIIKEGQTFKINLDGIKCNTCFNLQGNPTTPKYVHNDQQYVRPTQSLLQKWLRETHGIEVYVVRDGEVHYKDETRWITTVSDWNDIRLIDTPIAQIKTPNHSHHIDFKSYEEALEIGLIEGLKLIQQ
jgi:hypothetical protein